MGETARNVLAHKQGPCDVTNDAAVHAEIGGPAAATRRSCRYSLAGDFQRGFVEGSRQRSTMRPANQATGRQAGVRLAAFGFD